MDMVGEDEADAAIAELEAKVEELDDKLMEAEGAHENARRWFEEQKKQFARAEKAEAEARKWEWVAKHTYVCPLGEMKPGEPGSYVIEVRPSDAILARADGDTIIAQEVTDA